MTAWFRRIVRWLESGKWQPCDPDHWCGACTIGQEIERQALQRRYLEQPVREACELSPKEEVAWQRIRAEA